MDTFFSNSGLATALTPDQIYQVVNGRIRAIQADTTNDKVTVYFTKKDNSGDTNASTSERIVLDAVSGGAIAGAESLISALNGLQKHRQAVKIGPNRINTVGSIPGVRIPDFTITNTDVSIGSGAITGFRFTLGSATVGCAFTATLTMDDDSATETVTGTIATATDTIDFAVGEFTAGDATIAITLTLPTSDSNLTVSQAATIAS
mgnify:CR=1 FL=1|jgi:hypothetical protein